ncbi:GntR family transcriptional regulator [Schleiferilactobacillus shenzhenensis]|uniref:GntR family transcriptional regulator n=1 Tax=Schleiferilactobacillus shenzhenensis TaxID=1231337 RepID=UPI000413F190|nr:GntR family transcriptional regulator [Schleiferilactobacillus shenzhenensis]
MQFHITEDSAQPIYIQLAQQIIIGVATGELHPGEQLPATRILGTSLNIDPMTVSKCYQLLKTDGYVEGDRHRGTRISTQLPITTDEIITPELTVALAKGLLQGLTIRQLQDLCQQILLHFHPLPQSTPKMPQS